MSVPNRLQNGAGNIPDANLWNGDYDWLEALINGNFVSNGSFENWSAGTSFTNPVNGTSVADNWIVGKGGTTPATVNVSREASIIDSGLYSLKADVTVLGSSDSYFNVSQGIGNVSRFKNQTVCVGTRVKCSNANSVRIKVTDGVTTAYSTYHPGDGSWWLLQTTITVAATPTQLTVTIEINPSNFVSQVYMDSSYTYVIAAQMTAGALAALAYSPLRDVPATPDTTANVSNILINGGMEISQRATSFASPVNSAWTLDRWQIQKTNAPSYVVSQATDSVDSGSFSLKLVSTNTIASTLLFVQQPIENYKEYQGKTITLTVRVRCDTANVTKIAIVDNAGSSVSAYHPGDGSWQAMTVSYAVSSSATSLTIQMGALSSGDQKISNTWFDSAMLVIGSVSIPYVPTNPAIDLNRCQRYYETGGSSTNYCMLMAQGASDGTYYYLGMPVLYKVTKSAAPTVTFTIGILNEDSSTVDSKAGYTKAVPYSDVTGFSFQAYKLIAGNRPAVIRYYWTAEV